MGSSKKPPATAAKAAASGTLTNPHDSFFGFVFGQKLHAIGLLRASLPPELAARLDWESLERRPANFIDARLRRRYSDLLFSIRARDTQQEVLVYALVEHQSSPDPLMAFRVLRYVARVWEEHVKAHPHTKTLPLIFPLVIYHGPAHWKAARTLRGLIQAPADLLDAAAGYVPQLGYRLIDLQHRDADELLEKLLTAAGEVAVWAMRMHGHDDRVIEGLRQMADVLGRMMAEPNGQAALVVFLRYILATHQRLDRKKLQEAVEQTIDPQTGEQVVTVYEQLVEEGRIKGRAEGRAEGGAEILLAQLAAKFGPLPADVTERVKHADMPELTAWSTRVLTAATLTETLTSPPAQKATRRSAKARA